MSDLERAIARLQEGCSCVLVKGETIFASTKRGIAPLLEWVVGGFSGFSAADKIVGKAAALLYVEMGVRELYGEVVSASALQVLKEYNIAVSYGKLTEKIMNRTGDGICPMERTVADISDPQKAIPALKNKLNELRKKQ